jgi:polyferredoxin
MPITALRRVVQCLSLLLFVFLLVKTTWPLQAPVSPQVFLRADLLSGLSVALSPERSWSLLGFFWPALVLLAATVLFGRFFCGWLCPVGMLVEATDDALRARKRRRFHHPRVKYWVLVAVLVAALFGTHLFWFLDPMPLATRTYATVFDGFGRNIYNEAVPLLRQVGLQVRPVPQRPFALELLTGLMFVFVLLGALLGRRTWCRTLCPLGALLAVVGRFSLWRRRADEACNSCGQCVSSCPMHAIPDDAPLQTRQAECIQCYECVPACQRAANSIVLARVPVDSAVDVGRREFLALSLAGLGYGWLAARGVIPRFVLDRVIRPPGAIVRNRDGSIQRLMTEEEFRGKCLRCGQCMKACITGGLQPAVAEAGVDGFYTPVLKPRVGWCEQNCAACGLVCPSGALVPFNIQEKPHLQIGEAIIIRETCLAWQTGDKYRECLVCDEHCSYDAINQDNGDGVQRPVVDEKKCTGCGQCETVCPVKPEAAIITYRPGTPHAV